MTVQIIIVSLPDYYSSQCWFSAVGPTFVLFFLLYMCQLNYFPGSSCLEKQLRKLQHHAIIYCKRIIIILNKSTDGLVLTLYNYFFVFLSLCLLYTLHSNCVLNLLYAIMLLYCINFWCHVIISLFLYLSILWSPILYCSVLSPTACFIYVQNKINK